jgi:hypothetical protein
MNRAGAFRMLRRTAICLALLLWLTAFTSSHSYAEGEDACTLISKSDVESILGKADGGGYHRGVGGSTTITAGRTGVSAP